MHVQNKRQGKMIIIKLSKFRNKNISYDIYAKVEKNTKEKRKRTDSLENSCNQGSDSKTDIKMIKRNNVEMREEGRGSRLRQPP